MRTILAFLTVLAPVAANAQQANPPAPTMNMPNYSTVNPSIETGLLSNDETPTMARQKLARAVALRSEADRLREQDGGTLSQANLRYVQRKASAIRAGRY